ncbi:MAG: DUF86 domain-containing protein [bacterium]
MKKDFRDYINDILNSINEVEEFTERMSFNEFVKDKKTINAVIRSLEVLGEAVKNIPEEIKAKERQVPWKRMAGMRDKLIHEYFGVDLEIVWAVVKQELPPLKPIIQTIKDKIA